uniref:ATP-dependent DNA helicase n=1 Tax=Sander lucioperca TaxID=283035 RepID=A0A8C9XK73_SANLU
MCLADFAATCRIVYGKQTKGKNVLPLLNEMGFVQRRKDDKPAIIRFYRTSKEKYPEKFYGTLLKLYVPYRSEQELKRPYYPTYESFYSNGCVQLPGCDHLESVQHIVKRNRDKYEKNSDEIENAVEEFEQNRGVIDEWCNLAPESEVVRLECIEELEAREPDCENEQDNVPEYSNQANAATEIRAIRDLCVLCSKRVVCKANLWPKSQQFFFYINGGAGTGKSHLIKCIYSEASKILCKLPRRAEEADISNPTVLLTAFTGTAAFNISGSTLHSLLKLPRSLKPPFQGLGNNLDEVRSELLNAEILIIDEVSMVSKPLFAYVDARLKQIKGSQRPFGGMSVIAVGDFFQLPPVRQSKALCVYDPCEIDLWQEHFQMITLTEIMRQKDDVAFAEMLNRIRVKEKSEELSEADRALLSQAVTEPELCPTDVLHIFATNKQVDSHNSAMLALLHSHITKIDADDYKKDPQTGRMARQAKPFKGNRNELPDTLNVAEGVRVMLTRNIDVSQGLVNGSFSTLVRVISSEQNGVAHVTMLGLKMDDETAGRNYLVRRQFPVKLAFACTIHKVQGMTRTSAVVSLKHIFEPGMAYVAVSRVTSLSGLHILDMDEKDEITPACLCFTFSLALKTEKMDTTACFPPDSAEESSQQKVMI